MPHLSYNRTNNESDSNYFHGSRIFVSKMLSIQTQGEKDFITNSSCFTYDEIVHPTENTILNDSSSNFEKETSKSLEELNKTAETESQVSEVNFSFDPVKLNEDKKMNTIFHEFSNEVDHQYPFENSFTNYIEVNCKNSEMIFPIQKKSLKIFSIKKN